MCRPRLCSDSTRSAVQPGARTLPSGKPATVGVKPGGEVVLAAGAVHSPQILMLSGVGPKRHLQDVGVDVVADSPGVGTNLQARHLRVERGRRLACRTLAGPWTAHAQSLNYTRAALPCNGPPKHDLKHGCGRSSPLLDQGPASDSANAKHRVPQSTRVHDEIRAVQDHPACLSAFELEESVGDISITDHLLHKGKASIKKRQLLNWAVFGKGPLTSTGCDRGAFVKTDDSLDQPDLQLRFVASCALDPNGVASFVHFGRMKVLPAHCNASTERATIISGVVAVLHPVSCRSLHAHDAPLYATERPQPQLALSNMLSVGGGAQESGEISKWPSGITFQIIACRPRSRGSIRLAADTISQPPRIDLGYLSDGKGADMRTLREGIRLSRTLADTPVWKGLLKQEYHPGSEKASDADLDAYIKETLHSANAIVGTCAMGPVGQGVVSPEDFSVHGVGGLRVIDASVMPTIPGGQTGAPTVMIAERAAALMTQGERSVYAAEPQLAVA